MDQVSGEGKRGEELKTFMVRLMGWGSRTNFVESYENVSGLPT